MEPQDRVDDQQTLDQLRVFVADQMRGGADKAAIVQMLAEKGVARETAAPLVESVFDSVLEEARAEKLSSRDLPLVITGAVIAAVVGALAWAAVSIATDYELGILAWGIGACAGYAVVFLSQGKRGVPLQLAAVTASVFGILVGKYLTFYYFFSQAVASELGAETASSLSVMSAFAVGAFADNISLMLSGFDLLWVALAVGTAWQIPRGSGISIDP